MARASALALVLALVAAVASAEAPASSIRPMPRTVNTVAPPVDMVAPGIAHPRPRPVGLTVALPPAPLPEAAPAVLRPRPRPAGLAEQVELASAVMEEPVPEKSKKKKDKTSKKGSVCGDPAIKGEALAPIKAKVKGCGLEAPVRVTAIDGIRVNQPATISCDTAAAMKNWINKGLRPAMGNREVVEIRIAASYICRPRNNVKGAKISEHGRGKALDVAGFVFSDGKEWSVLRDYNKQIRKAHKAACGIFGTTLGPGSDGYHEDHLHFDIASYRGGPYCR